MFAIEFEAEINDGKIQIPKKYLNKLTSNVKVIILNSSQNDIKENNNTNAKQSAMGILKEFADISLIDTEKDAWGKAVQEKYANYNY